MPPATPSKDAERLYDWLSAREEKSNTALAWIVGFGHFDLRIPRHCCALWNKGEAKEIAFTGGIGAGTADLGMPEADAFLAVSKILIQPEKLSRVLLENQSTNTGENIAFLSELLRVRDPALFNQPQPHPLALGLVATPIRMRRVLQTAKKAWPALKLLSLPPPSSFLEDEELFASKGGNLIADMLGELDRLLRYPTLGYTLPLPVPEEILEAAKNLREAAGNGA